MNSLAKKITIVQNFVCTDPGRLGVLLSQLTIMARIFGDIKFVVNYNTEKNSSIVKDAYEKTIKNLDFTNNLEKDWALTTLELIKKCNTPYILYLCEDFIYLDDNKLWFDALEESMENRVDLLMLARIDKYTQATHVKNYCHGDHVYFYSSKDSPHLTLPIDAMHEKTFFTERLKEYSDLHSYAIPNPYEAYYKHKYSIRTFDILCAVPKKILLEEVHPLGVRESTIAQIERTRNLILEK